MSQADLVRTSRDGDQFHYLRAARLCLELLQLRTSLVAVTIEGTSPDEEITEGLNVIDLALYHGSSAPNAEGAASEETTRWLNFAKNCDAIARMLIGIGIDKASEHAGVAASEWADAASKAGMGLDLDIQLSDFLDSRLNDAARADERRMRELKGRIEKLESFSTMASALRTEWQKQLEDLDGADDRKSGHQ